MSKYNVNTYKTFDLKNNNSNNTFRPINQALRPINQSSVYYSQSVRTNINEANKQIRKTK